MKWKNERFMEYHRTIWMGFTHYFSHVNATPFVFKLTSPKWCFFSLLFKWIYLFIAFSELDIIVFPIFCFRYLPAFCWKILLPCHCMHPKYDKYGISAYYSIVCAHSHSTATRQWNGWQKQSEERDRKKIFESFVSEKHVLTKWYSEEK